MLIKYLEQSGLLTQGGCHYAHLRVLRHLRTLDLKSTLRGWGRGSVGEPFPNRHEALGLMLSTAANQQIN